MAFVWYTYWKNEDGTLETGTFDNLKEHLKLEDGSEIATDYDTFAEAFQAAQLINKADAISTNKNKLGD